MYLFSPSDGLTYCIQSLDGSVSGLYHTWLSGVVAAVLKNLDVTSAVEKEKTKNATVALRNVTVDRYEEKLMLHVNHCLPDRYQDTMCQRRAIAEEKTRGWVGGETTNKVVWSWLRI